MSDYQHIKLEKTEKLAFITLKREPLNVLNIEMMKELIAVLENLMIVVEARGEQLSFKTKKGVITALTVDGTDQLSTTYPNVVDREIDFVDDLSTFENNPVDPNAPYQELAYNVFADSINFFLGVMFRF